jgi:hypothetical protein
LSLAIYMLHSLLLLLFLLAFLKFIFHSRVSIGGSKRISLYCSLFTNYSCSSTKCEMGNEGDLYIGSYF